MAEIRLHEDKGEIYGQYMYQEHELLETPVWLKADIRLSSIDDMITATQEALSDELLARPLVALLCLLCRQLSTRKVIATSETYKQVRLLGVNNVAGIA